MAKASYSSDKFLLVQGSREVSETGLLHITLTTSGFHEALVIIHFTQLPVMHISSVSKLKMLDFFMSKICPFKRHSAALLLTATLEPFPFSILFFTIVSDGG